jgi:hypothetical protein
MTIDLRGVRGGTVTVRLDAITTDGKRLSDRRTYHLCAKCRTGGRRRHKL